MADVQAAWRDPKLAKHLIDLIAEAADRPMKLMEVCGTHTVAIARFGLREVMPENITLLSGPGCPVCVTANRDIDYAIEVGRLPDVVITTFGDMMKVPGSYSSLAREKADGRDIRIVYSPLDAIQMAVDEPEKQVVFLAVGFETTAPTIAATIKHAAAQGVANFSVLSVHKTVPKALEALVNDPDVEIDGFILPGHVSTIIGPEPYGVIAERLRHEIGEGRYPTGVTLPTELELSASFAITRDPFGFSKVLSVSQVSSSKTDNKATNSEKNVALDRHGNAMFAIRLRIVTQDLPVNTGARSGSRTVQEVDNNPHLTADRHLPRHSQVQTRRAYVVENPIDAEWKIAGIDPPDPRRKPLLQSRLGATFQITRCPAKDSFRFHKLLKAVINLLLSKFWSVHRRNLLSRFLNRDNIYLAET